MENDKLSIREILVADVGGSHITAAVFDSVKRQILKDSRVRMEVPSKGSADHIFQTWTKAIKKSLELSCAHIAGFGVAMPGPFDYKTGISYMKGLGKYDSIYGLNVKSVFADALGLTCDRIHFRNDAEAVVAGEILAGAGKDLNSVMAVTLGSGFGTAYANKGNCSDLNLGSFSFKDSIADEYFSTRWFLKRYTELTGKTLTHGVKELAELSFTDRLSKQLFNEFATNMSVFLKGHLQDLKPDILVIGGGISKASDHYLPFVRLALTGTRVVVSLLGEDAALIGAAESFRY